MLSNHLRLRFLASLAASGALVGVSVSACGGSIEAPGGSSSGTGGSSSGGASGGTSGTSTSGGSTMPTVSPSEPGPTPACAYGSPVTTCMTHAQLEALLRNPPRGGDVEDAGEPDAEVSKSFDPNGCLPAPLVRNDCCSPATSGPVFNGGTCCYVFCNGGCCGRPFLVAGETRLADVIERGDWMLEADRRCRGARGRGTRARRRRPTVRRGAGRGPGLRCVNPTGGARVRRSCTATRSSSCSSWRASRSSAAATSRARPRTVGSITAPSGPVTKERCPRDTAARPTPSAAIAIASPSARGAVCASTLATSRAGVRAGT